jgi:hypothetical protein
MCCGEQNMQLPFHMTHLAVTQWQNNAMVTQLGFAAVSIKFFEHGDGTLGSCLRMPKAPGFSVELPSFGRFMVFANNCRRKTFSWQEMRSKPDGG